MKIISHYSSILPYPLVCSLLNRDVGSMDKASSASLLLIEDCLSTSSFSLPKAAQRSLIVDECRNFLPITDS